LADLNLGSITQYDRDMLQLTLIDNPYIPDKIKKGILGYPQQLKSLIYLNRPILNDYHRILLGGEAYGGKTLFGAALSLRFMHIKGFKGLNTRKNYDDLTEESVDSIWGYIGLWNGELVEQYGNERKLKIKLNPPRIKSKEGGLLSFRAFDNITKKEKTRSKSYQQIQNDEAPELDKQILTFQGRSLRQQAESRFPKAIINYGNPQYDLKTFTLNESSQRFLNEYVEGQYVYVPMGWRTNPYIKQLEFEASLEDLDEIDKQSQKEGNWNYTPSIGDLIDKETIKKQVLPYDKQLQKINIIYNVLSIDLAGEGQDKTAITNYLYLENGWGFIEDIYQTVSPYPEEQIYRFIESKIDAGFQPNYILLEQEGGSRVYSDRHWEDELSSLEIKLYPIFPKGSKYNRARPMVREMNQHQIKINKSLETKIYKESKKEETYFDLLTTELLNLEPIMKQSPNLIDCLSLARNFIVDDVLQVGSRKAKIYV